MKKSKVLLIGWDAADWKVIDRLMANGLMPAMKRVVDNGVRGRLATLDPPLSPMLWTSIATGVRPHKHGILGFVEQDGAEGIRPVSSNSRKVNAIWNMLTMEGFKSNIVGWWPSNPVESINGCMVSNLFHQERISGEVRDIDDWEVPDGSVYPERLLESLKELRIHPEEITGNLIMPFVPKAIQLDKKEDKRLTVIQKFLAHATTVHGVSTELMNTEEWDFTAVYHDALDHFSHAFMKYHPPRMEGIDEESFDLFKDVVIGAYVFHDMMLERLLNMIDENTTVVICSDHGFHSDHLRPRFVPEVPSGPAVEHAPFGIFAAMGPGIKKGEHIYGASVLDITPTLLSLFGLPIGKDMEGKPLLDIFHETKEVDYIESWEKVGKHGGDIVIPESSNNNNNAALQQLVDLGYISDLSISEKEGSSDYLKSVMRENQFYLAKSYISGGRFDEALEILLEIENRQRPDFRYLIEIVNCSIKTDRIALAEEYITFIRKEKLMNDQYVNVLEAQVHLKSNRSEQALVLLKEALEDSPNSLDVLIDMGRLCNILCLFEDAVSTFERVTQLDGDNAYGYHGLGVAALRTEKYEQALGYFLDAIERLYHYPYAHFHLGETFALMKNYDAAIQSFHVVEAIAPGMPKTYRWLLDLYEIIGDETQLKKYRKIVMRHSLGQKTIITGMPGPKLQEVLDYVEKSGLEVSGNTDDLYGSDFDTSERNYSDADPSDIQFIPLWAVGTIPVNYSCRVLFVNDSKENALYYIQRELSSENFLYSEALISKFSDQESFARTWLGQQPDLDVMYLDSLNQMENPIVKQYLQ